MAPRTNTWLVYVAAWATILNIILFTLGLLFTAHSVAESQHRWCTITSLATAPNPGVPAPPVGSTTDKFQKALKKLNRDFGCDRK